MQGKKRRALSQDTFATVHIQALLPDRGKRPISFVALNRLAPTYCSSTPPLVDFSRAARLSSGRSPAPGTFLTGLGTGFFNALFLFDHYSLTCSEALGYALEYSTLPSEENESGRKNGGSW